jgi:D-glycero-D-manno-heptose 1,7-bisphosphate phosphatase
VVVSNQSAVARGLATPSDIEVIQDKIVEVLAAEGAYVDAWYYCFHHPESRVDRWRCICDCRKPAPGMIKKASIDRNIDLSQSFLVGNMWSDMVAARRAGVRGIMLQTTPAKAASDPYISAEGAKPWATVQDLSEAAALILETSR